ncbi:HlyD family efflux transporter periplasmic adaptor subunit [Corticibacter populi]|uniref:HlyD family efflux transporter periplasmic adaptor subunit n=2 Tax=Corticibacter populi TaxID=1550736 RepID=A0A3M6QV92_9BURK|nr:HlyD family efflux transporter periplasmic adaptor subunit [Corticibacter populi]
MPARDPNDAPPLSRRLNTNGKPAPDTANGAAQTPSTPSATARPARQAAPRRPATPAAPTAANSDDPGAVLAALARLEQRARACTDAQALGFLMVNDTHALAPYRQAALWLREPGDGDGRIAALSGLAVPDRHAPFNIWLARQIAHHADSAAGHSAGAMPRPDAMQVTDDAARWTEHLPAHAWWLPLPLQTRANGTAPSPNDAQAGLLLLRDTPWLPRDTTALNLLADAYAHAWRALRLARQARPGLRSLRSSLAHSKRQRWIMALVAVALLLLLLPVRQSVLAPAEVVARAPEVVRAPLQGVVDRIDVQPNQSVTKGQLLAALDSRELQGRLEAARQTLAVAEAEWRRGQQQALFDPRTKSELGLLQGKRDQAAADADYYAQTIARTELRAERDGIALFDDPADWIGRPVALGERIMQVADPRDAELDVSLPVADAIALPEDAEARLFLNAAPAAPIAATVSRVGYRATPTADGTMAYRVRARFDAPIDDNALLRVGLKGTAKLYGERTVLALYLLRRPLATLRVWLGL